MPRPRRAKPTQEIRARIEVGVYSQLQMLFYSPTDGKMRYGALGKVAEHLFAVWLKRVQEQGLARALKDIGVKPSDVIPGLTEENDPHKPPTQTQPEKQP